jgi:hypothetical protein
LKFEIPAIFLPRDIIMQKNFITKLNSFDREISRIVHTENRCDCACVFVFSQKCHYCHLHNGSPYKHEVLWTQNILLKKKLSPKVLEDRLSVFLKIVRSTRLTPPKGKEKKYSKYLLNTDKPLPFVTENDM